MSGSRRRGLRQDRQRDTYFEVPYGGLKLREEQPGRPHLIQFERASEPRQRESRYRIIEVSDGPALRAALAAAIGIRGVVAKRRHLLLVQEPPDRRQRASRGSLSGRQGTLLFTGGVPCRFDPALHDSSPPAGSFRTVS